MGKKLHTLGQLAFSRPWLIISIWLVALVAFGGLAAKFMSAPSSSITIPGTEAQKSIDRANELFPDSGKGSGQIVLASHGDKKLTDFSADIASLAKDVSRVEGVTQVVNPLSVSGFINSDGTIGYIPVQLKDETGSISEDTLSKINHLVEKSRQSNLQLEMGGGLVNNVPGEIIGVGEIFGLVIALVVLIITFGALIPAGLPILSAMIGVGVGTAGLFAASHFFTMNSTTPVLGVMLGLAVGIDYSLFIINKYRLLLKQGVKPKQAVGKALGTAGNAVVFAALTVIIALAALCVVNIPFMTAMGLAGASSIAVAALTAITFVPALLGLVGEKVFSKNIRQNLKENGRVENSHDIWHRWGAVVVRHPWVSLAGAVLMLAVIALPVTQLKLGLPTSEFAAKDTSERRAYDLIAKGFGVGHNGQLVVLVENLPAVSDKDRATVRTAAESQLEEEIAAQKAQREAYFKEQAQLATTPEAQSQLQEQILTAQASGEEQLAKANQQIDAAVSENAKYVQLAKVSDKLAKLADVKSSNPVGVSSDGKNGLIQITPKTAPNDQKTIDLIATLRSEKTQKDAVSTPGTVLSTTGSTALQQDVNAKLSAALPEYLFVVVGLSLVILIVAFRSILVPIKATLGFLLSVLACFGGMVAVFQWGWFGITDAPGPIVSFIPIIATGVLFGLAMDYEFFLVSGMHEAYARNKDAKHAIVQGFGVGSKVVTAAAIIMISVFGAFVTNSDATIQAIGFGLALGILVDAFLVRMTIVPALMSLLGSSAWWLPSWLDKILPHVSIEGEEETPARKK